MTTPAPPSTAPASATRGRLRRAADVRRVLRQGGRRGGRLMVLYVAPGASLRSAFVCGRAVGGAVVRNRGRRLMREAWRAVAPRARRGHDVVFVARSAIRDVGMGEVLEEMIRLLAAEGVVSG